MMSDNPKNIPGALHGELRIELHTHYAAGIWDGRSATETKKKLIGVPQFFSLLSRIHRDFLAGNVQAQSELFVLEEKLNAACEAFKQWQDELDTMIAMLPVNISVSDTVSAWPMHVSVHCQNPSGYRFACLLAGFDQLALRILQAHYYGLISMKERKARLHYCSHQIRRIFAVAVRYSAEPAG